MKVLFYRPIMNDMSAFSVVNTYQILAESMKFYRKILNHTSLKEKSTSFLYNQQLFLKNN